MSEFWKEFWESTKWLLKIDWEVLEHGQTFCDHGDMFQEVTWINKKTEEKRKTYTRLWF